MKYCLAIAITLIAIFSFTNITAQDSYGILQLHLKPLYDSNGKASGMSVRYQLPFPDSAYANRLELNLDLMQNLGRKADTVKDLIVKDDQGLVPVSSSQRDTLQNRLVYVAGRKTTGTIAVSYTIAAASYNRVGGANIDMQVSEGGLSGAFISILLLPAFQNPFFVSFDWELQPGDMAVSTFGTGDIRSETPVSYEELLYAQFIAGKLRTYPAVIPEHGFRVAGLGLKENQIKNSLPVYQKVYEELRKELKGAPDMTFLFIYRSFPGLAFSSGSATKASKSGSFLLYLPPGDSLANNEDMVALVAHEMVHVFLRGINDVEWYREGIADYLRATILYKAGLYSDSAYQKILNSDAAFYYKNADRLTPDSAVASVWSASQISWALSYSRGMLYFANLDARLKEKAIVKNTTVLSLVLDIQQLLNQDQSPTEDTWVQLLATKAGSWAVKDWQDMKSGKLLIPYPGAFGSKYVAKKINAGYFDLGFRSPGSIAKGAIIEGLDESSNAAKAGLKNGDRILETVDYYPAMESFDTEIKFKVKSGDEIRTIAYLPIKGNVEGWEWVKRK